MSIALSRVVNFGSRKGSLTTVGYAIHDSANSIIQARTTVGVTEIVTGEGIYAANISVTDQFIGRIIWDTGEGTPLYAVEDLDYKKFAGGGGAMFIGGGIKTVWTEEEKKKLLKEIKNILKTIKSIAIPDNSKALTTLGENILEAKQRGILNYKVINEALALIHTEVKKGDAVEKLQEGINKLSEGLVAIIENKEAEEVIKEAEDYVEAQIT